MTESGEATKQVLVWYLERKQAVKFTYPKAERSLLSANIEQYKNVIEPDSEIILQLKSELWDGKFIDITDATPISDHLVFKILYVYKYTM